MDHMHHMDHEVLERVRASLPTLQDQAEQAEQLGRLPDTTAKLLRDIGVVRLLQPKRFGGYEADPRTFFEAVMAISAACSASGWISGIVGVHPWELAQCDIRAQEEVWADDPDTWVCSTYMATGLARPVDGGYEFKGKWSFSSGSDVSEWIFLGGLVTDDSGVPLEPLQYRHFLLPSGDYTVVDGSWDVVGLCGTGSKDIVVDGVFVPGYRTVDNMEIIGGTGPGLAVNDDPVFRVPWGAIFPNAITASLVGIAEGALEAALAYQGPRVSISVGPIADNVMVMTSIGEAASDIDACRVQLLRNVGDMYEYATRGEPVPLPLRARGRRDQVTGSWRACRAVDTLFDTAGGGSLRRSTRLQRHWRDAHAALHHIINVRDTAARSWGLVALGADPIDWIA